MSRLVSCTGAQYCGVALIETKNRAIDLTGKLDAMLEFPEGKTAPRIHWTGCPNSCGQAQASYACVVFPWDTAREKEENGKDGVRNLPSQRSRPARHCD